MNGRMIWLVLYTILAAAALIAALVFYIIDKPFKRRNSKKRLEAIKKAKAEQDAQRKSEEPANAENK